MISPFTASPIMQTVLNKRTRFHEENLSPTHKRIKHHNNMDIFKQIAKSLFRQAPSEEIINKKDALENITDQSEAVKPYNYDLMHGKNHVSITLLEDNNRLKNIDNLLDIINIKRNQSAHDNGHTEMLNIIESNASHSSALILTEDQKLLLLDTSDYHSFHDNDDDIDIYRLPEIKKLNNNDFFYNVPIQSSAVGCRVVAAKTLKRIHKTDPHTQKTYFDLSYTSPETQDNTKLFYPHPMVFAFSQSKYFLDEYLERYIDDMPDDIRKKYGKTQTEIKDIINQDIENYRQSHFGKNRLLYYKLKEAYRVHKGNPIEENKILCTMLLP